jgi:hypothetical protein
MAGGTVEGSIVGRGCRIMIRAHITLNTSSSMQTLLTQVIAFRS